MTDETPYTPPPPRGYHPMDSVKRLGITFGFLLFVWACFAYIGPLFYPRVSVPSIPVVEHPQVAHETVPMQEDTRLEALEARVKALEEQAAVKPSAEANGETMPWKQTTAEEVKKVLDDSNRRLAALTLFGQLKEAALSGQPYRSELHEFTALMQGDQAFVPLLAKLTPTAEDGLPTPTILQNAFAVAVDKSLSPSAGSWSEKVHALIRVRKVGAAQPGNDNESILARAEAKLQRGDITQAVRELDSLVPPAASAMTDWKKQATGYLEAKDALDALQVALFKPPAAAP